ncbi:MAG: GNAT family N-acetyltransferase [Deltaproteobacteria bacterium]
MSTPPSKGSPHREPIQVGAAAAGDLPFVRELLEECGLPLEGVDLHFGHFFVARRGTNRLGCIGMELYGEEILLRSLAVVRAHRNRGIGAELLRTVIGEAKRAGGARAWGLTMTGRRNLFARFRFRVTPRDAAPAALSRSLQFQGACPESAVLIVRTL